ncbi:hypothetical protein MTP99_009262 [Tenebrio molitor]|nr:hypothetical protein MTP99_009262 [Tenebrio molitor]
MSRRTGHSSFPVLDNRFVVQWDLVRGSRMTVLVSEKKFCVPGGAPPESGLASSLAGLYRVGASTRWCGWVKGETVNRKILESR